MVLIISFIVLSIETIFAAEVSDIEGTKYEGAVNELIQRKIMSGYPDGTFKPARVITRAEFSMVSLAVIGVGMEVWGQDLKSNFVDINGHWAQPYIKYAFSKGIINGVASNSFAPDAPISYAQAITIMVRLLGSKEEVDEIGNWPTNYIDYALENGILIGIDNKDYNLSVNRGDAAIMVYNIAKILTPKNPMKFNEKELSFYSFNTQNNESEPKKYIENIAKNSDAVIGLELKINYSKVVEDVLIPISFRLYDPINKQLFETKQVYKILKDTTDSTIINSIPLSGLGNLKDGEYRVIATNGQNVITEKIIKLYTDLTYEDNFIKELKVDSLKFYSTSTEYGIAESERLYTEEFKYGPANKCIWWELKLSFGNPNKDIDFPIMFKIYDEKWNCIAEFTKNYYKIKTYQNNITLSEGVYSNAYGGRDYWGTGKYQVRIFVRDKIISEGNFKVVN